MAERVKLKRRNLREKFIKKYIEAGAVYCPYCQNNDLQYSMAEIEGGGAYQEVHCQKCEARWADSYSLVSVVELEKPKKGGAKNGYKSK
jgi:hypothetical protein